ncbi:hypothetical protein HK100_003915 [Physocladia obscura]|uniref:Secreted protein n=1 Tax=Physocladia obscura TaxID=109957 RepID=A0AAD5T7K0_9FUNG|nr:hypothetical protein HK100_003915 [Physocladia obscura]
MQISSIFLLTLSAAKISLSAPIPAAWCVHDGCSLDNAARRDILPAEAPVAEIVARDAAAWCVHDGCSLDNAARRDETPVEIPVETSVLPVLGVAARDPATWCVHDGCTLDNTARKNETPTSIAPLAISRKISALDSSA